MKRLLTSGIAILFAVAYAQDPNSIVYQGKTGELRIEHFSKSSVVIATNTASFSGNPVLVYWKDRGISISSNEIEVEATLDDQTGNYYPKTAKLSGGVTFSQDSDMAYSHWVQKAKELGIQPGPAPTVKRKMAFTSQEMAYSGDANAGTLTIPNSFNETYSSHGTELAKVGGQALPREYDDAGEIHGASGTIEFNTLAGQSDALRKASVVGPITFKFTRNGVLQGKAEPPVVVSGVADRLDADFLGAQHTVTITGNVRIQTQFFLISTSKKNPGVLDYQQANASNSAAKAVLFFGPKNELLRIDMEGSPTVTNVKPLKPGDGGN